MARRRRARLTRCRARLREECVNRVQRGGLDVCVGSARFLVDARAAGWFGCWFAIRRFSVKQGERSRAKVPSFGGVGSREFVGHKTKSEAQSAVRRVRGSKAARAPRHRNDAERPGTRGRPRRRCEYGRDCAKRLTGHIPIS